MIASLAFARFRLFCVAAASKQKRHLLRRFGWRGGMAGMVEAAEAAAVLAFAAAVRVAGSAGFASFKSEAAGAVTVAAKPRSFAMRAYSI
jgi:hypothetical protein